MYIDGGGGVAATYITTIITTVSGIPENKVYDRRWEDSSQQIVVEAWERSNLTWKGANLGQST